MPRGGAPGRLGNGKAMFKKGIIHKFRIPHWIDCRNVLIVFNRTIRQASLLSTEAMNSPATSCLRFFEGKTYRNHLFDKEHDGFPVQGYLHQRLCEAWERRRSAGVIWGKLGMGYWDHFFLDEQLFRCCL